MLTTGTTTAWAVRGPRAGLANVTSQCPAQPVRTQGWKEIGRPGHRSPRPDPAAPASGWCSRHAKHEPGRGQGHTPFSAVHSPQPSHPVPSPGWWTGRGALAPDRSWRPAFVKGMFSPTEMTGGEAIIGEVRAIAPGIAPSCRPQVGSARQARLPAPERRCCRQCHAALSVPPGDDGDDTMRTLACDRPSTGHVVDNFPAPVRTRSFPDLLEAQPVKRHFELVTGGWGRERLPEDVPWPRTPSFLFTRFIHDCCAQPPTLITSPGLA